MVYLVLRLFVRFLQYSRFPYTHEQWGSISLDTHLLCGTLGAHLEGDLRLRELLRGGII